MSSEFSVNKNHKESSFEEEVEKKSNKNIFFAYLNEDMEKEKYQLLEILRDKKSAVKVGKFNLFLKRMYQLFEFEMKDMLTFLDEEEYRLEDLISILNFENYELVRREIGKKFRLKKSINIDIDDDLIS